MSENKVSVIIESLKADILDGKYAPGSAFPSVKMICRMFNVSHLTAVKAIESLKQLGLVKSRNGVGTFVRRRMKSIGLIIVSMIGNIEILPPIAREISRLALTSGIGLDFADMSTDFSENDDALVVDAARRMVESDVSGVIFRLADLGEKSACVNREVMNICANAGVPLVLLDFDLSSAAGDPRFDFVGVDNREAGMLVGQHLLDLGVKSVSFVGWLEMCCNVKHRLSGLLSAIAHKRGMRLVDTYMLQHDEADMLKKWKTHLPDAIACSSDFVAAHVLSLLRKIGKRCPDDVLVTGVNGVDLATLVSPPLTTVRQPCEAIAQAAFETLLWRMENPDATTRRVFLAAELVVRESTTT